MTPSINRKQPKITDYRRYLANTTATRFYPIIDIKLTVRRLSLPFNEEKTENHLPHGVRMGPFPPPIIVGVRSVGRSVDSEFCECMFCEKERRQAASAAAADTLAEGYRFSLAPRMLLTLLDLCIKPPSLSQSPPPRFPSPHLMVCSFRWS